MKAKERVPKQKKYFSWLALPPEEREPATKKALAEQMGISPLTLINWDKAVIKETEAPVEAYDSDAWLRGRTDKADQALLKAVQMGSPGAIKIFYQLLDRLVEKQEAKVEIGLSAAEIARQHIKNQKWLREHGYMENAGVGQVLPELPVFLGNIRESKTPDEGDNSI